MARITKLFGKVTDVDATARYEQGVLYEDRLGKVYVYGKYDTGSGPVTCHKYHACVPYPASNVIANGIFTADFSDCPSSALNRAVVSMGRHVTDGYYGFFACKGLQAVEQATTAAGIFTDGQPVYLTDDKTIAGVTATTVFTASNGTILNTLHAFGVAGENSATTPTSATSNIFLYGIGYE